MNRLIRVLILVAALVATAYAEWSLAVALGWNPWVALTVPAALDLFLIHATLSQRDVAPAVAAVVLCSAASYTFAHDLDIVATPLRIAVSSIAPLILWRLHTRAPQESMTQTPHDDAQAVPQTEAPQADAQAEPQTETQRESAPQAARLDDTEARRIALHAYAHGVSARQAAASVTRSAATVSRWYRTFAAEGVTQAA